MSESAVPHLKPVGTDAPLFQYPIPVGVRLEGHGWFQFHHAWWRTSDFRKYADREVRAVWFDLLSASQDEDPVGTLPVAEADLAWIARVSLEDWKRLMARTYTPLHGWQRCVCSDGKFRLYHPKLLTVTEGAARSRTAAEERRASDRERKRLKELPERIIRAGGTQKMTEDMGYVIRLDQYLLEVLPEGKSRTIASVRAAMEALELGETALR